MESWQHVRGAGSRVRIAGGERARAAGGGAAAAGEEGDSAGTVGGYFEKGTPAWEWVVTVTQRGSPGGAGDVQLPWRRRGLQSPRKASEGLPQRPRGESDRFFWRLVPLEQKVSTASENDVPDIAAVAHPPCLGVSGLSGREQRRSGAQNMQEKTSPRAPREGQVHPEIACAATSNSSRSLSNWRHQSCARTFGAGGN